MTSYLPRFTLRRALIAIALFALFLGWLRPDRSHIDTDVHRQVLVFEPMWPRLRIVMGWEETPYQGGGVTRYGVNLVTGE